MSDRPTLVRFVNDRNSSSNQVALPIRVDAPP